MNGNSTPEPKKPSPFDCLFISKEEADRLQAARKTVKRLGSYDCRRCNKFRSANAQLHKGLMKAMRHVRRMERGMKEIRGVLYYLGMIE
jgi:hypothetical protein